MTLYVVCFLAGALTLFSPCILPVLPFVLSRWDKPFWHSTFPLLLGLALTFSLLTTLGVAGGSAVVALQGQGRTVALLLLSVFGATLLFPKWADRLMSPFVKVGEKLHGWGQGQSWSMLSNVLLGVATGFLWAPCAGPVLGLVLTGAVVAGPTASTWGLLLAYACGAMVSMAAVGLLSKATFKRLGWTAGVWSTRLRRATGLLVLGGALLVGLGLDKTILTKLSETQVSRWENKLLGETPAEEGAPVPEAGGAMMMMAGPGNRVDSGRLAQLPSFENPEAPFQWLNTPNGSAASLTGHVVLLDVWTFSCINCLRSVPFIEHLHKTYGPAGLVVVGVHSPEFAFEKDPEAVARETQRLGLSYPIVLDPNHTLWKRLHNRFWPAQHLFGSDGGLIWSHAGEGGEEALEAEVRRALLEASPKALPEAQEPPNGWGTGVGLASGGSSALSPETYLGAERAERRHEGPMEKLPLHAWMSEGKWGQNTENLVLLEGKGSLSVHFQARDVHLVLSPQKPGQAIPFRVRLNGKPPEAAHGLDVGPDGRGVLDSKRLWQLIRLPQGEQEGTLEIEFEGPGVEAFAWTFG